MRLAQSLTSYTQSPECKSETNHEASHAKISVTPNHNTARRSAVSQLEIGQGFVRIHPIDFIQIIVANNSNRDTIRRSERLTKANPNAMFRP